MVLIGWYINDAEPTPSPSKNWLAYHSYGFAWLASNFDSALRNVGANKDYRHYYNGLYENGQPGWIKSQAAFAELLDAMPLRDYGLRRRRHVRDPDPAFAGRQKLDAKGVRIKQLVRKPLRGDRPRRIPDRDVEAAALQQKNVVARPGGQPADFLEFE